MKKSELRRIIREVIVKELFNTKETIGEDSSNVTDIDKKIYDLLSDWIISSLSDTEKRQRIAKQLDALNIPSKYKEVPSDTLFRVGPVNQEYASYAYDYRGVKKMISWMKKIFNRKVQDSDITETPVNKVNIVICIPTFFKATKLSSGRYFDALWKSEYEVIVKK